MSKTNLLNFEETAVRIFRKKVKAELPGAEGLKIGVASRYLSFGGRKTFIQ